MRALSRAPGGVRSSSGADEAAMESCRAARAALAVLVAVGAVGAVLGLASGGSAPTAASALSAVAATVMRGPAQAPLTAGRYWYVRDVSFDQSSNRDCVSHASPRPCTVRGSVRGASYETWMDEQGTLRTRAIDLSPGSGSSAAQAVRLAIRRPVPASSVEDDRDEVVVGDDRFPPLNAGGGVSSNGLFSYGQLLSRCRPARRRCEPRPGCGAGDGRSLRKCQRTAALAGGHEQEAPVRG